MKKVMFKRNEDAIDVVEIDVVEDDYSDMPVHKPTGRTDDPDPAVGLKPAFLPHLDVDLNEKHDDGLIYMAKYSLVDGEGELIPYRIFKQTINQSSEELINMGFKPRSQWNEEHIPFIVLEDLCNNKGATRTIIYELTRQDPKSLAMILKEKPSF